MGVTLKPELRTQILEMRSKGLSLSEIGKVVGINKENVRRHLLREMAKGSEPEEVSGPKVRKLDDGTFSVEAVTVDCISSEEQLIAACKIDLSEYVILDRSHRAWTQLGEKSRIFQMHHVSIRLQPTLKKHYQTAGQVDFDPPLIRQAVQKGTAIFIPDTQNGYIWDGQHKHLIPLHDRVAMDAVWQVCAAEQPETIFLLGDMLDVAALSTKFSRPPTFNATLQPAIDEMFWWLKRLRVMCPESRIIYQAGNHESRKDRILHERAPELSGLKRAGDDRELMSLAHLLRLDELNIECVESYGDGTWLWKDEADIPVWVHHGDVAKSGAGASAKAASSRGKYHQVFGHVHRCELVSGTTHGPNGYYHIHTLVPGCLCRIDGTVPGVTKHPDWQHGFGVMTLVNNIVHPELVHVQDGVAVRSGTVYIGQDRTKQIAHQTGWSQMVGGR